MDDEHDIRITTPADPACEPLLASLGEEYRRFYGELLDDELGAADDAEFEAPGGGSWWSRTAARSSPAAGCGAGPPGSARSSACGPRRASASAATRGACSPRSRDRRGSRLPLRAARDGDAAVAAVALYRSAGYVAIPPYTAYGRDPRWRGFEKRVVPLAAAADHAA